MRWNIHASAPDEGHHEALVWCLSVPKWCKFDCAIWFKFDVVGETEVAVMRVIILSNLGGRWRGNWPNNWIRDDVESDFEPY